MKEKKARVEDALHATRAAVEEGVVPGGGVALIRALAAIQGLKGANEDQNHGIQIALRAMEAPLREIVANAGEEPSVVLNKVADGTGNYGYNAANRRVRRHDRVRHPGPDQGHPHRAAERGVDRRPDDHHRSDGGRGAEEGRAGHAAAATAAAWAAWAAWTSESRPPASLTHEARPCAGLRVSAASSNAGWLNERQDALQRTTGYARAMSRRPAPPIPPTPSLFRAARRWRCCLHPSRSPHVAAGGQVEPQSVSTPAAAATAAAAAGDRPGLVRLRARCAAHRR